MDWIVKRVREPGFGTSATTPLTSYRTRMRHDALDRISQLTYPDNDQVTYRYNPRNRVQSIGGTDGRDIVTSLSYLPSGQIQEILYGNGTRTIQGYDPRLRMIEARIISDAIVGEPSLMHFEYTFDSVSNLRRIDDRRSTTVLPLGDARRNTQEFSYDDLYRLTEVRYNPPAPVTSNGGAIHYRYDRIGNLLTQTSDITHVESGRSLTDPGSFAYGGSEGRSGRVGRESNAGPGPHALTHITKRNGENSVIPYDANGNMTNLDGLSCVWDFKNRLVAVEDAVQRAEYTYDYLGRRVIKRVLTKSSEIRLYRRICG